MNEYYPALFEPFKIGNCEIKNRIVYAPMDTKRDSQKNPFSDATIAYYAERAKGGAGLIVSGACAVPDGIEKGAAMISPFKEKDRCIAQIRKLVHECHRYGAKFFIQIGFNFGRTAFFGGVNKLVAPSRQPNLWAPEMICRELTTQEVEKIIRTTAACVKTFAKDAGCDGVCLVGPYGGYMADQFANASFNHRIDRFGGNVENRSRFTSETIAKVKELCGEDFPVLVRMSTRNHIMGIHEGQIPGEAYKEYGRDIPESLVLADYYVKAGADAFIPANGCYDALYWQYSPVYMPEGEWLDEFAPLTAHVQVPVIGPGRILRPEMAEQAIEEKKVTAVAMGRAMLAEPHWAEKAESGHPEEIRPCIGCNNGCIGRVMNNLPIMCAVNPDVYKEGKKKVQKTADPKKIMVVGAGISGMEAAKKATKLGHDVEVYEQSDSVGGIFRVAAKPDFKYGDERLIDWYGLQMKDLDIPVHLNTPVTKELIEEKAPDVILVATGSKPKLPPIAGIDTMDHAFATEILNKERTTGKNVVILGAGLIGCETAMALSEDPDVHVTVVEIAREVMVGGGALVPPPNLEYMRRILYAKKNITMKMRTTVVSCATDHVTVQTKHEKPEDIPADTLIISAGLKPENSLYNDLKEVYGDKVKLVGDAEKIGTIMTCIESADRAVENL